MFTSLRCKMKGHLFVDSRAQPGMQTCVRCKLRQPFPGAIKPPVDQTLGATDAA